MAQVHEGVAKHGDTYFTYEQTAGKGQRSRKWITTPGDNVIMSTVLYPATLSINDQFGLSMAVALSCHNLLKRYVPENISIKWPNDLYWNDRKAGGILIENGLMGTQWQYAVVGIGINVNQTMFPEDVKNPVSLRQILGRTLDVLTLARELCNFLETWYTQLVNGRKDLLLAEYNQAMYKLGENVKLRRNNIVFQATIEGADRQGMLVAQTSISERFSVGEVEWVI